MTVDIQDDAEIPLDQSDLRNFLENTLRKAGCVGQQELSVLLTDDFRIAELNAVYRQVEGPTDVLAFPQQEDGFSDGPLGDVVISVPTAAHQAEERGVSLQEEVRELALHGLLHLLGHDHERDGWEQWNQVLGELRPDE